MLWVSQKMTLKTSENSEAVQGQNLLRVFLLSTYECAFKMLDALFWLFVYYSLRDQAQAIVSLVLLPDKGKFRVSGRRKATGLLTSPVPVLQKTAGLPVTCCNYVTLVTRNREVDARPRPRIDI